MKYHPPSSEQQVRFLRDAQRLFSEGSFVASYKFALLHALADLAVLKGDDSGAPLGIKTVEIAERFVELYWRQVRPYRPGDASEEAILKQNTGRQATILNQIEEAQRWSEGSVVRLRHDGSRWNGLIKAVKKTVRDMPLWKLQTVGGAQIEFLYENTGKGESITLKPGVAFCLRAYYGLLRDLIRGAWLRYVRRTNAAMLGNVSDLEIFLFGQERAPLSRYGDILMDAQDGRCLYCLKPLQQNAEVDHFVPWSKYPSDLGHNLVLAHATCNGRKSDHLAAEEHLAAWHKRNTAAANDFIARFDMAALPHDLETSIAIAKWAYAQTQYAYGQVWVSGKVLKPLDPAWPRLLAAG